MTKDLKLKMTSKIPYGRQYIDKKDLLMVSSNSLKEEFDYNWKVCKKI